ncbi:MAG: GTPase Era [Bacillus thermozeamaize]|uniref:GTPase Era n=1 Tax=Bacillus thermozeamaize TaxID=230954 RepID=A0A1Y3PMW2_9BACI|nr:MAG: GTPase Era [Bacillus thermozeamaize]
MNDSPFKSGFAALIGRPNVGKSTLMNQVLGQKVAITSDKPQTTRNRIHGVYTSAEGQIIFIDTPGIHKPHHKLGDYMMQVVRSTLSEVDVILFLTDVTQSLGAGERFVIRLLEQVNTPVFLILNKIDQVHPDDLLPVIDRYRQLYDFAEVIPVSALYGNNVSTLIQSILRILPEGPMYYPPDQTTDHPETFIVAELIREKILHLTHEEVPHSVAVVIEEMTRREEGVVYIHAVIYTERQSQKGILIGKQGQMLKRVGQMARQEIEALFGSKVFLDLWVKVKEDWRNRDLMLRNFGYQMDKK